MLDFSNLTIHRYEKLDPKKLEISKHPTFQILLTHKYENSDTYQPLL